MPFLGSSPARGLVGTTDIDDDAVSLAKIASGTDGELITWDASGNPAAVGAGTSGHFLKSQGAGSVPVFAAAGGGKVLQVVSADIDTQTSTSSTSYEATGMTVAITPSATSSKVYVIATAQYAGDSGSAYDHRYAHFYLDKGGAGYAAVGNEYAWTMHASGAGAHTLGHLSTISALVSPSSTAECTFKVYVKRTDGSAYYNYNSTSGVGGTITAFEIGA
tara:strand:+ start:148 stop:804 length:657 start_codon:yes stop_codon:yes gene_type:complete